MPNITNHNETSMTEAMDQTLSNNTSNILPKLDLDDLEAHPLVNDTLSKDELIEMREIFFNSCQKIIGDIERDWDEKNLNKITIDTHALKGLASNVGAERLFVYTSIINAYAKANQLVSEVEFGWIDKIKQLFDDTRVRMEAFYL